MRSHLPKALWLGIPILMMFLQEPVFGSGGQEQQTRRFDNFIFHYPEKEKSLVSFLGGYAGMINDRVSQDLGLEPLGDIEVTIVSTEEAFLAGQPPGHQAHQWAAAVAYPSQGKILMKSPRLLLGGQPAYEKVFFHEIAHIALDRALRPVSSVGLEPEQARSGETSKTPIPLWLHEGYAIYLSRDWSLNREVILTRAVLRKGLIPLGRLVSSFPEGENQAQLAYAQSADLVHYLLDRYGNQAFHRFLTAIGKGYRFGHACRETFDSEFLELEAAWKKHLRFRYSWIPILSSTGMLWFLASLVFLAAYLRKRLSARARLAQWAQEEPD